MAGKLYLLLGGQSSGKTARGLELAEQLAEESAGADGTARLFYLATAVVGDEEMKKKAALHRAERIARGRDWQTVEVPSNLPAAMKTILQDQSPSVMVVDSLTLWLFNIINDGVDIAGATDDLLSALTGAVSANGSVVGSVVVVSDEINFSPVAPSRETRFFCQQLGQLHQRLARAATHVELLVAGIPHPIK